jgi:hypothetical protein
MSFQETPPQIAREIELIVQNKSVKRNWPSFQSDPESQPIDIYAKKIVRQGIRTSPTQP